MTKRISSQIIKYDPKLKLEPNEVFLLNGTSAVAIDKLYYRDGTTGPSSGIINSWEKFEKYKATGELYFDPACTVKADDLTFYSEFKAAELHTIADTSTGYSKHVKPTADTTFDVSKYVYVMLGGESIPKLVKIDQLVSYEGVNEVPVSRADHLNKNLFYKGKAVDIVYIQGFYTLTDLKFRVTKEDGSTEDVDAVSEKFDPTTKKITRYSIELDANGQPVINGDGTVKATAKTIDARTTVGTKSYVEKTIADEAKPGATKTVSMAETKKYVYDENGEYVRVRLAGNLGERIVKCVDLKKLDGTDISTDTDGNVTTKPTDLTIGQSVLVDIDGTTYRTEPLTAEQVGMSFSVEMHYEPSTSKDDVLAENTHLKLKNDGNYVSEREVARPKYYKEAASGATPDAYLVTIGTGADVKQFIVDVDKLKPGFKIDGVVILDSMLKPLTRVEQYSECTVVQTSNNEEDKGIHSCKVFADTKTRNAEKQTIDAEFEAAYRAGEYQLDKVYVNGVLKDLDPAGRRYIHTESTLHDNYASEKAEYKALKPKPFYYEIDENGNLSGLKGGPQYSWRKGVGADVGAVAKLAGTGLLYSMSGAGILIALAAPLLVGAAAAAAVASPIAIMAKHGVRKWQNSWKHTSKKYEQFDEYNIEKWKQELVKLASAEKSVTAYTEEQFAVLCNAIRSKAASQLPPHNTTIKMTDGKIEVSEENIFAVRKFVASIEEEKSILNGSLKGSDKKKLLKERADLLARKSTLTEKELERLELLSLMETAEEVIALRKKKEKGKTPLSTDEEAKIALIESKLGSLKSRLQTARTIGVPVEPDDKSLEMVERSEIFLALQYAKYFEDQIVDADLDSIMTAAAFKSYVKDMSYDLETGLFTYQGKKLNEKTLKKDPSLKIDLDKIIQCLRTDAIKAKVNGVAGIMDEENEIIATRNRCLEVIDALEIKLDEIKSADYYTSYEIIENINVDALRADVLGVTVGDTKANMDVAKGKIAAKLTGMKKMTQTVKDVVAVITEVETEIEPAFNENIAEIKKLMKLDEFKLLSGDQQDFFADYIYEVEDLYEGIKENLKLETHFDRLDDLKVSLQSFKNKSKENKEKLQTLMINADRQAMVDVLKGCVAKAQHGIEEARKSKLDGVSEYFRKMGVNVSAMEAIVAEIDKPETKIENARILKDKALLHYEIIGYGVGACIAFTNSKAKTDDVTKFLRIIFNTMEIAEADPPTEDNPSIEELKAARNTIKQTYEELIAQLTITKSTTRTPREPKLEITMREEGLIEKELGRLESIIVSELHGGAYTALLEERYPGQDRTTQAESAVYEFSEIIRAKHKEGKQVSKIKDKLMVAILKIAAYKVDLSKISEDSAD